MSFKTIKISDHISVIQETGVANFMRCNIWHVRGRDYDLIIDTGMGLSPLKDWVMRESDRPIKAIMTHSHFDHSGSLHEFDCRLGHRAEAHIIAKPNAQNTAYVGAWTEIEIVDLKSHPDYSAQTYGVQAAPLTGYLDEGDMLDLGDHAYQILHLPGHSPGSIGLWDVKTKTLFSGDAIYNGELLDTTYHSEPAVYQQTLRRIKDLGAEIYHAGHYPSFGQDVMNGLVNQYLAGNNTITDVQGWFDECQNSTDDMFADQDWNEHVRD